MKRVIIALMAFALVSAAAGNLSAQGLSFGIKGGLNMAKYTGSDAGSNDMKIGAVGGAFACVDLVALKIQPELLFSQKGAKTSGTIGTIDYTGHVTANYVEVPVLLKYSFGMGVVPSIYLGPSFGMLLSATSEVEASGYSASADVKSYYNSTDVGLVVGAEVKTPLKLSVEARYEMGLTNVPKEILGVQPVTKNSTISLMIGYYMF
ncbi:MAG TPA: porin family protein [Candidatus Edwardsbacteria bacterium]|nr:porin family protein [Candidatus Edwardsbacteria bacterium]